MLNHDPFVVQPDRPLRATTSMAVAVMRRRRTDAVVGGLWRYPVKSLQGSPVERIELRRPGVEGDRQWGIVDAATGKVLTAKRWPALLEASADARR